MLFVYTPHHALYLRKFHTFMGKVQSCSIQKSRCQLLHGFESDKIYSLNHKNLFDIVGSIIIAYYFNYVSDYNFRYIAGTYVMVYFTYEERFSKQIKLVLKNICLGV